MDLQKLFAVLQMLLLTLLLYIYLHIFSNKYFGVAGLKAAIIGYAVLGVIAVIALAILVPDPGKASVSLISLQR